jgi:hypothetical protein
MMPPSTKKSSYLSNVVSFYKSLYGVAPAICFLTWSGRLLMWRDHFLMALRSLIPLLQRQEDALWHKAHEQVDVALKKTYPIIPADCKVMTGPNARGSFGIILSTLGETKDRYALVTGLQHRSFFAYMKAYDLIPIPVDIDPSAREFTFDPESVKDKDIAVVIVTHVFGRVQNADTMLAWANQQGIPVILDACLGPFFQHYPFQTLQKTETKFVPDVVIWSCGADKEPCASSGALMVFPHANPFYEKVRDKLYSLPRQSVAKSVVDNVLREIATWSVYNTLVLHKLICTFVFIYWGMDLVQSSMQYYKNIITPYKGSVYHKGTYLERPCTALVQTILRAVQRDTSEETALFYQAQREWLSTEGFLRCFPWMTPDEGPDPRPFYDFCVVPDAQLVVRKLCGQGILCFPNTTYYSTAQDSKEPRAKMCDWYVAHLIRFPILARVKQDGCFQDAVEAFQEVLPKADFVPVE